MRKMSDIVCQFYRLLPPFNQLKMATTSPEGYGEMGCSCHPEKYNNCGIRVISKKKKCRYISGAVTIHVEILQAGDIKGVMKVNN